MKSTVDSRYLEVEGTLWNTSRYPYFDISVCRTEENTNRTTKFLKWTCNFTPLVRNICWKYCGTWEKYFITWFYFYVKTGIRFSFRDKRLFEITEVEITRVDCITILNAMLRKVHRQFYSPKLRRHHKINICNHKSHNLHPQLKTSSTFIPRL